ncbi:LysE family transporter [Actinotalea sp. M2MS4P-6]|uniref:LysE family transporter n=1 Tax=Actinotalea sp. M2MS4P-6 TaxID=2983762 RepID=UPI0021E47694|nr:LysE family transporter [Actinotalea sp. M2MS4P-6]MCV2393152.1 LysE family transporter [Actinotalea sp. M2MS4P-6]
MPDLVAALLVGVVAGLGVAVPLGAVGVLLLRTGIVDGWRVAASAALGVASVDLAYAAVATVAGSAVVVVLAGREHTVRLVGAVVLVLLAGRGLWGAWRARRSPVGPDAAVVRPAAAGVRRTWARFVGLTALNPLTVVYFAVVAAGLATRWVGVGERVTFVIGVGVASAAWQLVLAGVGAYAGAKAGPGTRLALGVAGDLVVLGLAVALALS